MALEPHPFIDESPTDYTIEICTIILPCQVKFPWREERDPHFGCLNFYSNEWCLLYTIYITKMSPKYHHNRGFGSLKNDKETSSLGEPPFFAAGAPRSDTALVLGHRWPPAAQPPASSAWSAWSAPWRGGFQWRRGVRRCLVAVTTW